MLMVVIVHAMSVRESVVTTARGWPLKHQSSFLSMMY
jgi:hypothetical protein